MGWRSQDRIVSDKLPIHLTLKAIIYYSTTQTALTPRSLPPVRHKHCSDYTTQSANLQTSLIHRPER